MKAIQVIFNVRKEGGAEYKESTSFANTSPEIKNITFSPSDENTSLYKIIVEKKVYNLGTNELKCVIEEATTEAQIFIYIFSYVANVKFFDFNCEGYKREENFTSIDELYKTGITFGFHINLSVTSKDASRYKAKIKSNDYPDLSKLQLFYDSATILEPIGRFISLYTLLLHRCSDNQYKVDEAILKIDTTIIQYRSPAKKGYETVFTKLRNELSHKRDGTNIIETHNQIRKNIERFEQIVKNFVLDSV